MFSKVFAAIIILAVARMAFAAPEQGPELVRDGKALAVIVTSPELPTGSDLAAARELQNYLKQITGAELPLYYGGGKPDGDVSYIVVGKHHPIMQAALLSEPDVPNLGEDGFVIRTAENHILLAGNGRYGSYYAVYAFLEALGCRFYSFREGGELIPKTANLRAPVLNITSVPHFEYRDFWANGWVKNSFSDADYQRWIKWQVKLRQGGRFVNLSHNLHVICPPERYGKTHPEYFALRGGKRQPDYSAAQLCLSNPDVQNLAVQAAQRYFTLNPDIHTYSLVSNDNAGWCECARCTAMGPTVEHRYAAFVNLVAERLRKTHPNCYLTFMPEYPSTPSGRPENVEFESNVMPVNVNYFAQYADLSSPLAPEEQEWMHRLKGWSKATSRQMIYEWIGYTRTGVPAPQWHVIGQRIRAYADIPTITAYSGEVISISPETEFSIYMGSRMLWDPSLDSQTIVDEYFEKNYGANALLARQYFQAITESVRAIKPRDRILAEDNPIGTRSADGQVFYNQARLNRLSGILNQFELGSLTPYQTDAVERLKDYNRTLRAIMTVSEAISKYAQSPDPSARDAVEDAIRDMETLAGQYVGRQVLNFPAVIGYLRNLFVMAQGRAGAGQ